MAGNAAEEGLMQQVGNPSHLDPGRIIVPAAALSGYAPGYLVWRLIPAVTVWTALIVGCSFALYIFIVHSATTRRPYINFAVFRDSNFVVGLFLIFLFGLNIFSALLLMPLFLQDVQGYPVIAAGIIISSRGVGTAFGMIAAGRLAGRIGYRYIIVASLIMVAVPSAFMVTWTDQVPAFDVLVVNTRALVPGCVINVRPVGVLIMEDNAGQDEKVIAVPSHALTKRYDHVVNYADLPEITMQQIEHFFEHYKDLEPGKWVKIGDWHDADTAKKLIVEAIDRANE